ncbi:hypothetical protein M3Y99_00583000 [Aphelenchoides fujianensis]|nr:hypothetical protein M3Y99_00583000 [Aphelenchoides fujianensis]
MAVPDAQTPTLRVIFVLPTRKKVPAAPALIHSAALLQEGLKDRLQAGGDAEWPIPRSVDTKTEDVRLLNKFVKFMDANFPADFRKHAQNMEHWMRWIPMQANILVPLADHVHKDCLIRSANLGDYLQLPAFIAFCTYIMREHTKNLNPRELLAYLNEDVDFPL